MLKLKDIYNLPGNRIALTDYSLREDWFPEVNLRHLYSFEVLQTLETEGRLVLTQLLYDHGDGSRYASMHYMHFDGQPTLIVSNGGRGGDDVKRRWVTDPQAYSQLIAYLASKAAMEVEDLADPEEERYPEEVFFLYGKYRGEPFGYAQEPRRDDVLLITEPRGVYPPTPADHILALVQRDQPDTPTFIRRGECVLEKVAQLTRDEMLAANPRLVEHNDQAGVGRVYVYRPCSRPKDQPVQPV
ncbi:hypothetical protein D3C71_20730 [compost metagenome]